MAQKISIDPTLWAKVRVTSFETQRTASSIVEEALTQWFEHATSGTNGTAALTERLGEMRELRGRTAHRAPADAVLTENPTQTQPDVFAELATRDRVGIGGTITESHDEDGVRVIDRIHLAEVSVTRDPPEDRAAGAGHIISSPADVERFVRPIRPVPKPTSTKRPSRRREP